MASRLRAQPTGPDTPADSQPYHGAAITDASVAILAVGAVARRGNVLGAYAGYDPPACDCGSNCLASSTSTCICLTRSPGEANFTVARSQATKSAAMCIP